MNPESKTPINDPSKFPLDPNQAKDDHYAASLAKMVALDYEMEQKAQPQQKHLISKKVIIYMVISLIISILATIVFDVVMKKNNPTQSTEETEKSILNSAKDVRDLEN